MTTHTSPEQVRAERQALIDRAVVYMDATPPAELSEMFARLGWKPELRHDPSKLRKLLADRDFPGGMFSPYKAAQKILHAAGLYDYPTPTAPMRCEVVDQIIEWTEEDGALQIEQGDLILDDGQLRQIDHVALEGESLVSYSFDREVGGFSARRDGLVAVRRYIETEEPR
ncbi:hypothetical protein ACGFJT_37430 [Actinomadura geliboluensis]|uniref:hypothetical protein n=1 Tax=Actinomadura geliboluensis TaxID=882440 RepID=UPI0037149206